MEKIQNENTAPSDYQYLQKLNYSRQLENRWFAFFVKNTRVTVLAIAVLFILGIYSFLNLPRESTPEVKIPVGVVTTVLPGANPSDVEELVTQKLEKQIAQIPGIDEISSVSQESLSTISVEFNPSENLDNSIRLLRDRVAEAKRELPTEAQEPQVIQVRFEDQAIWVIGVTGPYDGFSLRGFADIAKDELEKIPNVSRVEISGGDEAEFEIAYDPAKLAQYNLSIENVNNVIKAANVTFPVGNFEVGDFNYVLRINAKIDSAEKLRNLAVSASENPIYLRDVAEVMEKGIKRSSIVRFSVDGNRTEPGVTLSVFKRPGGSIIDIVKSGKLELDNLKKNNLQENVSFVSSIDQSKDIARDFERLSHDAVLTFSLVFITLFLIIGLREAAIAALAVPLVFAVSFTVLNILGFSLNFLSLFSLILSLGLLVDDAIVVVSATNKYFRSGKFTPEEGVILVLNDFKGVLLTTTLTTVWAFAPLVFASGILGQFIKSIPVTVSITLISSLIIAITVNHPLAAVLERLRPIRAWAYLGFGFVTVSIFATIALLVVNLGISQLGIIPLALLFLILSINIYRIYLKSKLIAWERLFELEKNHPEVIKSRLKHTAHDQKNLVSKLSDGLLRLDRIYPYYDRFLRFLFANLRWRRFALGVIILIFIGAFSLPISGVLKAEFFPSIDQDIMFVTIEGPPNWRNQQTDLVAQRVEKILLEEPAVENFSVVVGAPPLTQDIFVSFGQESNRANFIINLKERKQRNLSSLEIAKKLRGRFDTITEAKVSVEEVSGGPPAGSAFTVKISGEDLKVLEKIALDFRSILETIPGTINHDVSIRHGAGQFTIYLDQQKLATSKLNAVVVATTLRTAVSGSEVTKILQDSKDVKVVARFDQNKIPTIDQLSNTQIVNLAGQSVYLSDVAKITLEDSLVEISRADQKRIVSVTSDAQDVVPNQILSEFKKKTESYEVPDGYEILFGGINEEFTESVQSILRAMVIAVGLIIITLVIQFNSFRKVLIVLVTIPLAVSGAFYGLTLLKIPLSFPGLIGVLALFGIVVKNAIILVDKMNLNISMGISFTDAVVDAAKSRLEAIFLTSIATIFGVLPITLSNPLWLALGSALISGLALSTFLTLITVPLLYYMLIPHQEEIKDTIPDLYKPPPPTTTLANQQFKGVIWQQP